MHRTLLRYSLPRAPHPGSCTLMGGCFPDPAPKEGREVTEILLDTLPLFDGMIAAIGRLFVALEDDSLMGLTARTSRTIFYHPKTKFTNHETFT